MDQMPRRSFCLAGLAFTRFPLPALGKSEAEKEYRFITPDFSIRMSLEYYDGLPNSGLRFKDGASSRSYCLSPEGEENDHCLHNFKGSIAIAHYNICPRAHESAGSPIIRELVRNIDQSEQVPLRPPFERVIQVQRGRASDIQVFGYTEDALDTNAKQPDDAWRLLRQNLYLGQQSAPFLVLHWKHTIMSIRMLDVIPQNGTRLANRS